MPPFVCSALCVHRLPPQYPPLPSPPPPYLPPRPPALPPPPTTPPLPPPNPPPYPPPPLPPVPPPTPPPTSKVGGGDFVRYMWHDKPWFQELQDICVDYIERLKKIKLYARDDTSPVRQRSLSSLAFLVDGRRPNSDCDSADSGTHSCVGCESKVERGTDDECIFSDFSLSDAEGDPSSNGSASYPSSPLRSPSKRIFSARAKKNFKSCASFQ